MTQGFPMTSPEPEQTLFQRLSEHKLINLTALSARVRHDVAYLDGHVPNLQQKKLIGQIAGRVDGVNGVINNLRVVPLPVVADVDTEGYIRRSLQSNLGIDPSTIAVNVENGFVQLSGFVSTPRDRCLVEWEAWAAPGVLDLMNKIEVISPAVRSDIQITSGILQDLANCLGLDVARMVVELHDGVVYLHGSVPDARLKAAAEELVRWNPQVTDVVNKLRVAPSLARRGRPGPAEPFGKPVR